MSIQQGALEILREAIIDSRGQATSAPYLGFQFTTPVQPISITGFRIRRLVNVGSLQHAGVWTVYPNGDFRFKISPNSANLDANATNTVYEWTFPTLLVPAPGSHIGVTDSRADPQAISIARISACILS